jgi:peptidoglycan/LPS O-acetylase OafA/YrhL
MGIVRFILACAVVLCHTSLILGYSPVSGNLAVQCFYIISGFYMALILNEKYTGKGANFLFYSNRALKIYPIYWINLILLVLWSALNYKLGYQSSFTAYATVWPLPAITLAFFILVNLFIVGIDSIFLLGITKRGDLLLTSNFYAYKPNVYNFAFNSIAWTIGIELLFYLIAPFIARKKIVYPIVMLIASLLLRIILAHFGYSGAPWDYMFFPTQLMFFMAGILSYKLYKYIQNRSISKTLLVGMYILLLIIILLYYQFFQDSYLKQAILFIAFVLLMPASFIISQKNKFDRMLGNLSYSVYISQALLIKLIVIKEFPKIMDTGFTALVVIIAFSIVLDYVVSRPIERYRQKRISNKLQTV